jgi:hypothetical protein
MYAIVGMMVNLAFAVSTISQFMFKDQPITLDGCETHNEVFEGHFEFQIMPQR